MKIDKKVLIKTLIQLIPAFLWMVLIFYFSSRTGQESSIQSNSIVNKILFLFGLPNEFTHFLVILVRKTAHIIEYLILFLLIFFGLINLFIFRKNLILSFIISIIYASLDEFHQLFSQGRSAELRDILIDSIGILIGMILIQFLYQYKSKK